MSQPYALQTGFPKRPHSLDAIEHIFKFMQQQIKVEVWITHSRNTRITGIIRGFDEWMNLVMDQAIETNIKTGKSTPLGRIMLKGDNVCLVHLLDNHSFK